MMIDIGTIEKNQPSKQVWAVMIKEDDPNNPGQKIDVALWANRAPVNLKQKYEWFTSQEAFDEYCKFNKIYQRKI